MVRREIQTAALGYTKAIPAFLDPKLTKSSLLHGSVLSLSKQLEYFLHYKLHLSKLVGGKKAEEIINNAVFIVSMGTDDFLQNYYLDPTRPEQYLQAYLNFLISCMSCDIQMAVDGQKHNGSSKWGPAKCNVHMRMICLFAHLALQEMHRLGASGLVIARVPPLGCMPLVKTLMDTTTCSRDYNKISFSFNSLIRRKLDSLRKSMGLKTGFVDTYAVMQDAINRTDRYGLTETSKRSRGTRTVEYGDTGKGLTTCSEPEKYAFWNAVHPTEKMFKIHALKAIASFDENPLA
ncbi:hypothetical protein NL676_012819 [Syzygium grande]|nr:hypothetical protein NL676_012819 [Syzygium grande]